MVANDYVTERREVCGFDRVVLRVYNIMNSVRISQGEHESLIIEGEADVLSKITTVVRGRVLIIQFDGSWIDKLGFALSTSLTRPTVRYHLTVKDLVCLDLIGLVQAGAAQLRASNLSLKLSGTGEVVVGSLTAQSLAVDLRGVGRIELAGQVADQRVTIEGPGHYQAANLMSRTASVSVKGIGRADIWATDSLAMRVRGMGHVGVRGMPKIKKDVSPRAPSPKFSNP